MPESINISQLLELRKTLPVLDTRSEGEYDHAHIPGAKNLPLLNNEERAKVGTCYKQKGREEAVLLGFDLVGHKFGEYIRKAKEITTSEIVIYCWRGGLRSNTMAWLLEKAGLKVYVLEGGYKTFRHWTLNEFEKPLELLVLGGKTGSGKTDVLHEMKNFGEQVIDLEALAHHRGSSFGALGQPPQPTTEQFENLLALELAEIDRSKTLWLENESSKIGTVKIPDSIFYKMRSADVIEIDVSVDRRVENIIRGYASFPQNELKEATERIEKKLGNKRMNDALNYLTEKDFANWIKILLEYYDKAYLFGTLQRSPGKVLNIQIGTENHSEIAKEVIDFSKQIIE